MKAFVDVDVNKIGRTHVTKNGELRIPILSYLDVTPPVVVCVAKDRYPDTLVPLVLKMGLIEGENMYFFC